MLDWLRETSEEACHPCLLVPVVQWYHSELTERGRGDLTQKLEEVISKDAEGFETVELLDAIKTQVSDDLAARLREFDCAVQSFKSEKEGGD